MEREIALDTETTGLSPERGDRLVEIGCVELVNHLPSGNSWRWYINPQRPMPAAAQAVHGLSDAFLADKPVFSDIVDAFLQKIDGAQLVIHNAPFDLGFLNAELQKVGHPIIEKERVTDTLELARRLFPSGSNSLDALCRRFHIDNSRRQLHGALLDAELLAEVYLELLGGRQSGLDLGGGEPAQQKNIEQAEAGYGSRPKPLGSLLVREEIIEHQRAVQSLGETAIWHKYLSDSEASGDAP